MMIHFKLPSKPEYCDIIRLATAGIARQAPFAEEAIEDIRVAVGEACLNIIRHAYYGKPKPISLTYHLRPQELEIFIKDKGKPFKARQKLKEAKKFDPQNPRTSGFGLYIMKSVMDVVEITSTKTHGNCVKLVKRFPSV